MRIKDFFSGGGGLKTDSQKTVRTTFCGVFFSPQLILQFTEGVQWFYYRQLYFSKDPEGVQHFPGGGGGGGGGPIFF